MSGFPGSGFARALVDFGVFSGPPPGAVATDIRAHATLILVDLKGNKKLNPPPDLWGRYSVLRGHGDPLEAPGTDPFQIRPGDRI